MNTCYLLCIKCNDFFAKEIFVLERFNTCDLRDKDVINLCDGSRLGCPTDFEFNICDGKITALIISGQGGFLGLGHSNEIIVPWCKIECIGEDAILVRLDPKECIITDDKKKHKKSIW
jgi:YlmC/YmxH family sporulation protein